MKGCLGEKAVSVVIHGKEHLMLRKALNPLFSPAAIRGYMPQVQAIAEACVGSWLKQGDIKGRQRTCASPSGRQPMQSCRQQHWPAAGGVLWLTGHWVLAFA